MDEELLLARERRAGKAVLSDAAIDYPRTTIAGRHSEETGQGPRWTIVLAFYNEAGMLAGTLRQLLRQTPPFRLVLIDNGSTDDSAEVCRATLDGQDAEWILVSEHDIQGQVAAIEKGLARVDTELVATCDADTWYPCDYLARAETLFDADPGRTVAVSAYFVARGGSPARAIVAAVHQLAAASLLPWQTHVGGAGQCFRSDALRAAGGYSLRRWPYLLADHEVMHRVMKHGRQRLGVGHWCSPSTRRSEPMRWSLLERAGYHLTPFTLKDRYFRWLADRFRRRHMLSSRLRLRDWDGSRA